MDFVNFDNICHVILKKKLFLSGVIVSVNTWRKDFRVTFVSFGLYAGRFTENAQNMETIYFHILTF